MLAVQPIAGAPLLVLEQRGACCVPLSACRCGPLTLQLLAGHASPAAVSASPAATAAAAAAAGETIMRIPMRLAITDKDYSAGDEDNAEQQAGAASYAAQDEERPWSVRLAGKLLGLAAQGAACPWQPYLRVLPERVPSPLTTFSREDVQAIEVRSRCLYVPCFLLGVCECSAPILFRQGQAAKLSEYLGWKPWPVITAAAVRAPHLPLAAPRLHCCSTSP